LHGRSHPAASSAYDPIACTTIYADLLTIGRYNLRSSVAWNVEINARSPTSRRRRVSVPREQFWLRDL
jgi:hypothetical protein